MVNAKQKKNSGTVVVGLNGSVGFGAGLGGSYGIGYDHNGNIGVVYGWSAGAALPTASVTGFISVSNASNIEALKDKSIIVGALGGEGVTFGGEVNIMPDTDKGKGKHSVAVTGQIGIGVGVPLELHGERSFGYVYSFNIYDILIAECDYILD